MKGDDIFIEPLKILPPPAIEGHLTAVRIEGDQMVQEFARVAEDSVFGTFVRPSPDIRTSIV